MIINIFHLCERQFTETVRDVNATGEICAIRSVKIYVFASIVAEYATNQQANRCFSCVSCFNPRTRDSQTQTLSRQNGTLSMSNWIISCYLSVCSMLRFLSCGGSVVIVVGMCVYVAANLCSIHRNQNDYAVFRWTIDASIDGVNIALKEWYTPLFWRSIWSKKKKRKKNRILSVELLMNWLVHRINVYTKRRHFKRVMWKQC